MVPKRPVRCLRYVIFPGVFNMVQQVVIGCTWHPGRVSFADFNSLGVLILFTYALFNRSKFILATITAVFVTQIIVIGWSLGAITAVPLPPGFVGCRSLSRSWCDENDLSFIRYLCREEGNGN